jgi:hypothetical protein
MPSVGTGGVAKVLVEFLNAFIDAIACAELAEFCLALA